jgi:hypothetical protein
MAPFEALYGRKCRTPLFWNQTGESELFGLVIIKVAERQVEIIRENLKIAQSRKKSYADHKRREVVFEVGDHAVDVKSAPHAKHTASRTSWLNTRAESEACQSIFPETDKG